MAITKISTPELFDFSATNTALQLPTGTTLQRPTSPSTGEWRFNTTLKYVEYYDGVAWFQIATEAAATFIAAGNFETVTYTGTGLQAGDTQKINGYIRKGAAFNGSSSKINISGSPFNLTTYSLSFWINANDYNQSDTGVVNIGLDNTGGSSWSGIAFGVNANKVYYYGGDVAGVGGSGFFTQTGTTNITNGNWYNVVMIVNGTSITGYINGVQDTGLSRTLGANITYKSGSLNTFGVRQGAYGSYGYWNGKIDQVRIFNTAITSGNVDTLFLETSASSTKSTTDIFGNGSGVALYEMEDNSLSSNFGQAAVFNGSSSRIVLPKLSALTANVSVSGWVKIGSTSTSNGLRFLELNNTGTGFAGTLSVLYQPNNGDWIVRVGNGVDTEAQVLIHAYLLTQDVWYNVCFTRNNSSNETKFYVDGVRKDTETVSINGSFPSNATSVIGDLNYSSSGYSWLGSIDQIRIFNSTLEQADVTKLYEESSQIPTTNLVAHYTLNGNALDSAGSYDGAETSITYGNGVYGGTATNVNYLGMAFQPDLVWIKERSGSASHTIQDSIRGPGQSKNIYSDNTAAQGTYGQYGYLSAFDTNGFTVVKGSGNHTNTSGETYVAWCWKAAAITTTIPANSVGNTIASDVRANVDAGFSIVSYTGNLTSTTSATAQSVGHGLGAPPDLIITKATNGSHYWPVRSSVLSDMSQTLVLNTSVKAIDYTATYPIGSSTNDVFYTNWLNSLNVSGQNIIAYCFASVPGYQKVGSYTGSGPSTKTVYTTDNGLVGGANGFRPRFLMIKDSSTLAGENWIIVDSLREGASAPTKVLYPNTGVAEDPYTVITFTSNGFTVGNTGLANTNGATIIYLAIA